LHGLKGSATKPCSGERRASRGAVWGAPLSITLVFAENKTKSKLKEVSMKNSRRLLGVLVLALVLCMTFASCATYSHINGIRTPLGGFTSAKVNDSRKVIAEYFVILGLVTSGYEEFLAQTKGKNIDIIDVNYLGFFQRVQAVSR
jgi:hypothetical protein